MPRYIVVAGIEQQIKNMSKNRLIKLPKQKPGRGPNGRRFCRWCEKEVPKRRSKWCSDECFNEYAVRSNMQHVRFELLKRDNGICDKCGLDCVALFESWRQKLNFRDLKERLRMLDIPDNRTSLWDCAHIIPVHLGGGSCGLDNYRTLCIWCHKAETVMERSNVSSGVH